MFEAETPIVVDDEGGGTLVTGATGFVGSALVDYLLKDGTMVRGAVRRDVSPPVSFEPVIVGTINQETEWSDALVGVNTVVHLAARAHVLDEKNAKSLEAFRQVNVEGTLRLARQAVDAGVKRFIFMSSIGVNGNSTRKPFTEADSPNPQEPYAISKYEAEQKLWQLSKETGMELVVIRPPLVYGPNAPGNFGKLVTWVKKGVPLPLGAVRDNRRSFVALDNLVDLIVTCLDHPKAANETFLVSDGEDLSTADLLQRVAHAMGRKARLVPVPVWLLATAARLLGKQAVAQRLLGSLQVDSSKARELLGWVPPVSVDEGLKKIVNLKS